jgi:hypothetical protein
MCWNRWPGLRRAMTAEARTMTVEGRAMTVERAADRSEGQRCICMI